MNWSLLAWMKRLATGARKPRLIYPERLIPKTYRELTDRIAVATLTLARRNFPNSSIDGRPRYNFEGMFHSIRLGIENLRKRFGDAKTNQLLDMLAQAKIHHEEGWRLTRGRRASKEPPKWWEREDAPSKMPGPWQQRIGNALLQDMEMVIRGRQPWAYPEELYRWRIDPTLLRLSEAELLKKDFDEDYEDEPEALSKPSSIH